MIDEFLSAWFAWQKYKRGNERREERREEEIETDQEEIDHEK